jgi:hypothetical protein
LNFKGITTINQLYETYKVDMSEENSLVMSRSSFYKYFEQIFGNTYEFGKNHMDACPICTRIFVLEEKLKNLSKLEQLEEIKVKYLKEADLKYSKWKKDTKLVEKQIDRTMKEEESAEISKIEDE